MRRTTVAIAAVLICIGTDAIAAGNSMALEKWIELQMIPYVKTQLTTHPRFKGETVLFVVLDDNQPTAVSNELALSLRDRVVDAAIATAGISIGWRQGTAAGEARDNVDCTKDTVHYFVGVQIAKWSGSGASVQLRALDLEERSWVTGFGLSWRGELTRSEYRSLGRRQDDHAFRGERDVPFSSTQTDLLAQHIAHEMSCQLLRQTSGEYVLAPATGDAAEDELAGAVELVGNNLAANRAIDLTDDSHRANATIRGSAHKIDGALHQYWLTISPLERDTELETLSVSAYVLLPTAPAARLADTGPPDDLQAAIPTASTAATERLIGPLNIEETTEGGHCDQLHFWTYDRPCSLLRTSAKNDAIVFFVRFRPHHGMQRVSSSGSCQARTTARVARRGKPIEIPIAYATLGTSDVYEPVRWLATPSRDTWYAVAVSDSRIARRIANHLDRLPSRCGGSRRAGLSGAALDEWLEDFAVLVADNAQHIDWRAIEVKDVL